MDIYPQKVSFKVGFSFRYRNESYVTIIDDKLLTLIYLHDFRERSSERDLDKFKLLSDHSKIKRRKLTDINIMVTFIVWLAEFVGSILLIFVPSMAGHGQFGNSLQIVLVMGFYFVLLPFLYLVNDSDIKKAIMDDSWLGAIRGIFNRTNIQVLPK